MGNFTVSLKKGGFVITHTPTRKVVIEIVSKHDTDTAMEALSRFFSSETHISEARLATWRGAIYRAIAANPTVGVDAGEISGNESQIKK